MKKVLAIVIIAVVVLAFGLIGFSGYIGMFSKIEVYEKEIGPYHYVYKEFRGDYKLTGPVFDEVYDAVKKEGIKSDLGIGIYYDDPAKTPVKDLRSDCGTIIAKEDVAKAKNLNAGLKTGMIKKSIKAIAEFPIKNTLSYMFGPMKAYPALAVYAKEKEYKEAVLAYEIYDVKGKKIFFVMDIVK